MKTKNGLISKMYGSQRSNSKRRGHLPPSYSKSDFHDWIMAQPLFHHLFSLYANSNFDTMLVPSVDRKNDDEPYNFSNIKLTTWSKNKKKGYEDRKNGKTNTTNKAVLQFDLDGNFVREYFSCSNASNETNISRTLISRICRNKKGSAGGYLWEYKIKGK